MAWIVKKTKHHYSLRQLTEGQRGGEIHSYCMYMKHPSSQRDLSGEISPPQAEDFTLSKNRIQ